MTFGSGEHPGTFARPGKASQAVVSTRDSGSTHLPEEGPSGTVSPIISGNLPARIRGATGGTLLTVRQVAERLCLSTATVYDMIHSGELPASRLRNRALRVSATDLARVSLVPV